ncbi:murein biosynthesis integral membrane protein MurJ [Leucobacter chinensis]|uniref:murein biosynthesis integral membrane protein MurJ n=1 Tax=Leucobacter chinensis TaxID=2851010 RepID=UPI001C24128C|nr:lipid II flippase MurJ [Leucobacter chinensis]
MSDNRTGRASVIIAAGTLTSRLLGVFRVMLLAHAIGATGLANNAYWTAMKIPNTVYILIITGALTAVLVPQITKAALSEDRGQKYINKLVTLSIVATLALLPVVAIVTPALISFLGAGWDEAQLRLAVLFAWWLLPQIVFFSLYTVVGEVLNAKKLFGPYSWSPVLANVINIAGLVAFLMLYDADPAGRAPLDRWDPLAIALVAGSATLGVAVQGLILFAFWKKIGLRFRFDFRFRGIGLGTMGKVAFWLFLTVLVAQLVGLIYTLALNLANSSDVVGSGGWEFVRTIAVMPHSVIVMSLVTANFTRMSESVHAGRIDQMKGYLTQATGTAIFAMVFVIATMSILAMPIMRMLQPKAPHHNLEIFAPLLVITMIGMLAQSLLFVFNRGFYALSDTKRPFYIAVVSSAVALLGALFCMTLPPYLIPYVLAFSEGVVTFGQVAATFLVLRGQIGRLTGRNLLTTLIKTCFAAFFAAIAGFIVLVMLGGLQEGAFTVRSFGTAFATCLIISFTMLFVYGIVLKIIKSDELDELLGVGKRLAAKVTARR